MVSLELSAAEVGAIKSALKKSLIELDNNILYLKKRFSSDVEFIEKVVGNKEKRRDLVLHLVQKIEGDF